ncbi:unnamed protein product [Vitrella brassicaformis CCMP3155]|uniref:ZP domain-containing protein n=1 Tax=Vitrella brassicaformis (strain CCMP3155) TaxID=1169540 RepID=A0A0G4GLH1_VITBC|nr:unnamed protein product [Vitrella brassicaformis CCMP3155]|eukprot:CEM30966.1 unnamed protein product [Vitrella brassicaformis CCMP3155]
MRVFSVLPLIFTASYGQPYIGGEVYCGETIITWCFPANSDYAWPADQPKLSWGNGSRNLATQLTGPSFKLDNGCWSFNTTETDGTDQVTCIQQPIPNPNYNPCEATIEISEDWYNVTNTVGIQPGDVDNPLPGDVTLQNFYSTQKCVYARTYQRGAEIQTYTAQDVTLQGYGEFIVDFLACGKLDNPDQLCSDSDMYDGGAEPKLSRTGKLYFRSCIKGVEGADLHLALRHCSSHNSDPRAPPTATNTTLVTDYCGSRVFTDSSGRNHVTKTFVGTAQPLSQCGILEVGSHRYVESDILYVTCVVTVCTAAKCSNLKDTAEDGDTCRQDWSAPPNADRLRRLSNGEAEEGIDFTEVLMLTTGRADGPVIDDKSDAVALGGGFVVSSLAVLVGLLGGQP